MRVYCLDRQESLYETKILQRMIEPVFIPTATVNERIDSPLLLYGNWYRNDFAEGLSWLSSVAYQLPYPCIVLPPYELGSINEVLKLQVGMNIIALNTNRVILEKKALNLDRISLRIQVDYGFIGPAGSALAVSDRGETIVVNLQPRSSSTPLILCGLRILSTSGLSDAIDRQDFLQALINWGIENQPEFIEEQELPGEPISKISSDIFKSIAVLLAVETTTDTNQLKSLAKSTLGIDLSEQDIDFAMQEFDENGLIELNNNQIISNADELENFIQDLGLWPYVRMLREDINFRN